MSKRQLEAVRWASFALCVFCWVVIPQWQPAYAKGGWGVLLFFGGFLLGLPGAMLTLHLHPPKWFRHLERPKR
jgi:di/tricarboxylate transporter